MKGKRVGAGRLLNADAGRYGHTFSKWIKAHGFEAMRPSDRSHAITLFENCEAIERWRATLPVNNSVGFVAFSKTSSAGSGERKVMGNIRPI